MKIICDELVTHDFIDKALEIARQYDRHPMQGLHVQVAEKYAAANEKEKAKAALRKEIEWFAKVPALPIDYEAFSIRSAKLAATLGEKEIFYEITNITWRVYKDRRGYSRGTMLVPFTRQLALYGDKDHPLHKEFEELATSVPADDGFERMHRVNGYPHLLMECALNRAILGDHVAARSLFKKAMEIDREMGGHRFPMDFCSAIIEARAYEKR